MQYTPIGLDSGLAQASEQDKRYWKLQDEINKNYHNSKPQQDVSYLVDCLNDKVSKLEFFVDALARRIIDLEIKTEQEQNEKR